MAYFMKICVSNVLHNFWHSVALQNPFAAIPHALASKEQKGSKAQKRCKAFMPFRAELE